MSSAGSPLIEARGLCKQFRVAEKGPGLAGALRHLVRPKFVDRVAVDRIDLEVHAGEAVGYVGPNGAGKSTTLKMLSGVLRPSAGELRVGSVVPSQARARNARQIGVVFGHRSQLWWDLPVRDTLRLLGDIYDLPARRYAASLERCVELLELAPLLGRPARTLSLGERMRCDLAAALLHEPAILYLDEPTLGLDLVAKDRVRALIREIRRQRGVTILLTSHDLDDVTDLCTRLVLIDIGRIVFDGPITEFVSRFDRRRAIELVLREPGDAAVETCARALAGLPPVAVRQADPQHVTVEVDLDVASIDQVMARLLPAFSIADLHVERPQIEDVLRSFYAGRHAGALG